MDKKLYKVTLNHSGEIHIFYTKSKSEAFALNNAVHQLCKKLKINYSFYRPSFNGQKDNFKVKEKIKCQKSG